MLLKTFGHQRCSGKLFRASEGGHESMYKCCWASAGQIWPLLGILLEQCKKSLMFLESIYMTEVPMALTVEVFIVERMQGGWASARDVEGNWSCGCVFDTSSVLCVDLGQCLRMGKLGWWSIVKKFVSIIGESPSSASPGKSMPEIQRRASIW